MVMLYGYLEAVLAHWWGLVPGGILAVDAALEYLWEGYRKWLDKYISQETRKRLILFIAIVGVFISGFLAWKDEHIKATNEFGRAEGLQAKLNATPPQDFEKHLKNAEARADQLQRDLETATKVSERQGQELEVARKELRSAETKIQQLEARFVRRRITQKQKIALVKRLRGQGEGRIVTVKTVNGVPPEAFIYAQDFIDVLSASEWKPKFHGYWFLLIENVAIRSRRNDMVAAFLQQQFEEAGIKMPLIPTNEVGENEIDIVIGPRS